MKFKSIKKTDPKKRTLNGRTIFINSLEIYRNVHESNNDQTLNDKKMKKKKQKEM